MGVGDGPQGQAVGFPAVEVKSFFLEGRVGVVRGFIFGPNEEVNIMLPMLKNDGRYLLVPEVINPATVQLKSLVSHNINWRRGGLISSTPRVHSVFLSRAHV